LYIYGNEMVETIDSTAFFGSLSPSDSLWCEPLTIYIDSTAVSPSLFPIILLIRSEFGNEFWDTLSFSIGAVFFDNFENMVQNWSHHPVTSGYNDEWHISNSRFFSSQNSWKCGGPGLNPYSNNDDAALISPFFYLPEGSHLYLRHYMEAETSSLSGIANDGGIVEIQIEGGDWETITPVSGYPYVSSIGNPLPTGTPFYSGNIYWEYADFDLSGYFGWARVRFRFTSDAENCREGWYIDDIFVTLPELCEFPVITFNPLSFLFELYPDEEATDTLYISNIGSESLQFNIDIIEDSTKRIELWLSCNPSSGIIPPDSLITITVNANSYSLLPGNYQCKIIIHSNDPVDSILEVPVQLVVGELAVLENRDKLFNFNVRPNPFTDKVILLFHMREDKKVDIKIYDVTGRVVKGVFSKEFKKGRYIEILNLNDLPRGVYFLKFDTRDFVVLKKMIKI